MTCACNWRPTTLNATLGVGELSETITVSGAGAELINTITPAVTATLNVEQIAVIPTPTRNALNAVTFMVGVNTSGGMRGSTINGLPESFLNLTLDGISNNDTFNKNGDGFFSPVRAASGCGRGRHRDDRRWRRRGRRSRRRDDQLRHALGNQPLYRQRV